MKDYMPDTELQVKAYLAAKSDVYKFGHFCGGFFLGLGYTISTYFSHAEPSLASSQTIPPDSVFWYSKYYGNEARQLRASSAWFGTTTSLLLGTTIYLIVRGIGKRQLQQL